MVNYKKWEEIQLSDDSDIEVHPNVDKKSFIRAKQYQIHEERQNRRHRISTLKYERIVNDGLITRIDRLITRLKSPNVTTENLDDQLLEVLTEFAANPAEDKVEPPPEGVHTNIKENPNYSKMIAVLVDQVKDEVNKKDKPDKLGSFIEEVEVHKNKVTNLQGELEDNLAKLEAETKRYITSDDIHTGFDVSHVSRDKEPASKSIELLNPDYKKPSDPSDSGLEDEADIEDHIEPTELGSQFSKIKEHDYEASLQFIRKNPSVLSEKNSDGILVNAFNSAMDKKLKQAKRCVHQALILQYCRQLSRNGVELFFKRLTTKDDKSQKLFAEEVDATYHRIRNRAAEIVSHRASSSTNQENVEQIQLHAVDPKVSINVSVPPALTTPDITPQQRVQREIFESFSPGLQHALEVGSLDAVNKVLGKLSVEEGEEVVAKLGQGGMLSLQEGVMDATTDEGKKAIEELEKRNKNSEIAGREEQNNIVELAQ